MPRMTSKFDFAKEIFIMNHSYIINCLRSSDLGGVFVVTLVLISEVSEEKKVEK